MDASMTVRRLPGEGEIALTEPFPPLPGTRSEPWPHVVSRSSPTSCDDSTPSRSGVGPATRSGSRPSPRRGGLDGSRSGAGLAPVGGFELRRAGGLVERVDVAAPVRRGSSMRSSRIAIEPAFGGFEVPSVSCREWSAAR